MTEWLSQYEKVAERQQQYLQKIRDLRQRLQTKDERYMMLSIERMRKTMPFDNPADPYQHSRAVVEHKSHVPWSSSLLAHSFHPKMSSPSPRLSIPDVPEAAEFPAGAGAASERGAATACFISGERLFPKAAHHRGSKPRKLNPISCGKQRLSGDRESGASAASPSKSDIALERNKTDYEPIEDIARRNRIQFSRYLSSRDGGGGNLEERDLAGNSGKGFGGYRRDLSGGLSVVATAGDDAAQRDV